MTAGSVPPPVHHYEEQNESRGQYVAQWLVGQYALYILVALLLVATITKGSVFWGNTNLTNLSLQMSIIGVVTLAELIVVLTGGIDISVGSALGLSAVVAAGLLDGPSVFLAVIVALMIGGMIGAVNGWLVSFRGLEPFIVTLGMLALARGLVYAYGNGIPITPKAASSFATIGQTTLLGIPVLALIWLSMVLLIAFLLYRTVWGRRVYAIGSNKEAAPQLGHPGALHTLVGLHPRRPARRLGRLDVSRALRQRHFHGRKPAGTRGDRRSRHRRRAPVRRPWQGLRNGGGHRDLCRDRQPAFLAQRLHLPPGRLPRCPDPGGGDPGHCAFHKAPQATAGAAGGWLTSARGYLENVVRISGRPRSGLGVCALLLAVSACGGQIYPSSKPAAGPANGVQPDVQQVVIGFAQQQLQAPYFAAMEVRARQIAKEQGFKLLFQAANKDPVIQMNQMQAMMAQGAHVLVVNATSVKGQKEMMTQIASKIPVVYIDTSVPGTGTTSVQSDNLTIGRESGKITAQRFLDMGKKNIKIVILTGPATDEFVGPQRRKGFLDGLKEGGVSVEIQAEQAGDYAQDKGQVAAENMLAANPDIDLVVGLNDSMTLGAYNVVSARTRYKNVYVAAAADGQKEGLALIKSGGCSGRYISTGLNSPSLAAEDSLKIAIEIATGSKKPADYPPESFTKAVGIGCKNIDEFYDPKSVF